MRLNSSVTVEEASRGPREIEDFLGCEEVASGDSSR